MPGKSPGPSIKRPHQYEALKEKFGGDTPEAKEKAARISNAQAKSANGGRTPTKKTAAKQLAANKRKRNKK